ncbi:hypothetical protein GF391_01800 [Candidatus Uhrbacteria bacterium]|nr:hypothetical protein [Candidatus Uhrbacteria bacterium]
MKYKNTLQKGSVRYLVFKEGETWYAVGFEFNIVESGDTPEEAMLLLFEALKGYLEAAKKMKLRPNVLNQKTDPEYEQMWQSLKSGKSKKEKIFSSGSLNIAQALQFA